MKLDLTINGVKQEPATMREAFGLTAAAMSLLVWAALLSASVLFVAAGSAIRWKWRHR